jgi:type VI protein secretion system component VasK
MSSYLKHRLALYAAHADHVVYAAGCKNGHQDATASEPLSAKVNFRKLSKVIQAGQFLLQFAAWQQKLQKRLRLATTVDSTLAALQLWSSFHFYDQARAAIVSYVIKRLKRLVKQSSQQYTDAQLLKQWSTALYTAVQEAAHKLKQVNITSAVEYTNVLLVLLKLALILLLLIMLR